MQQEQKNITGPGPALPTGKGPKINPMLAIHDFCKGYHQHEVKQLLWDWLVTAMSKNHSIYDVGKERSNLIFFYEQVTALVEAAYALHQHQIAGPKTKKTNNKNLRPSTKT